MSSIFTKIVNGDIPAHVVAETDQCLAFLDINPIAAGHTLVIPKQEIDYYFEIPDELIAELNVFAKKVATGIRKSVNCKRIGQAIIGLEVPHAHIHLIPIDSVGDINFGKPKLEFSSLELTALANKIKGNIQM